jgi:hypothetical protein
VSSGGAHVLFGRGIRRPTLAPSNFLEWKFVRPRGGRKDPRESTTNVDEEVFYFNFILILYTSDSVNP